MAVSSVAPDVPYRRCVMRVSMELGVPLPDQNVYSMIFGDRVAIENFLSN